MISNPAHEYDTINVFVRLCMTIASHFKQEHTVITVDQQLFSKLHPNIKHT